MTTIGPGDWVELISVDPGHLRLGALYRIASLEDCEDCSNCGDKGFGAALAGDTLSENFWCVACELRPIYRPKADLFESLKASPERRVGELTS